MIMPSLLQHRTFVLMSGALCLLALGIAAEQTRPYPNLTEVLNSAKKFNGRHIAFIVECRVGKIRSDGLVLKQMNAEVLARTHERNFRSGDDVVVEGIFHAPATLEVTRMHVVSTRRVKMAISVIPVIVVTLLVFKNVGFDRKGGRLYLKESPHA